MSDIDYPTTRALVLLDLQQDFLSPDGRLPVEPSQSRSVVEAAKAAMSKARQASMPVIGVYNAFPRSDIVGNVLRRFAALEGSPGAIWTREAPIESASMFKKRRPDAFTNACFERFLRLNRIGELLIGGVFASACVAATTRSALAHGYRVKLLVAAIGDSSERRKSMALKRLASFGAELI